MMSLMSIMMMSSVGSVGLNMSHCRVLLSYLNFSSRVVAKSFNVNFGA